MFANSVDIGRCPPDVDLHIAPDGPTQLLQRLQECPDAGLKFRIVRGYGQEHPDAPHAVALLRMRRERPNRRAAEQREEIPPPQIAHVAPSPGATVRVHPPAADW